MDDFATKFLQARDGKLTPEVSYQSREGVEYTGPALCFVQPLELIKEEDWHDILVAAAALPEQYVEIEFRFLSSSEDEACRVFESHIQHFIEQWEKEGLLGSAGGSIDIRFKNGTFYIGLFPIRPEDLIPVEEAREMLLGLGFSPKKSPDRKLQ